MQLLEQDKRSAFERLGDIVHQEMEQKINARLDSGKWQPTESELELDAYKEEIEPQVWDAEQRTPHVSCNFYKR